MPEQLVVVRQGAVQVTGGSLPGAQMFSSKNKPVSTMITGWALHAPCTGARCRCTTGMHCRLNWVQRCLWLDMRLLAGCM